VEKYIACDLECDSLNTVRGEGKVHSVALYNEEIQVCMEWGHEAIDFLAGILADGYVLVFHSAQYDVATLRHFTGWELPPSQWRCTQVLAHAINPQLNSYSLDFLTGTKIDYATEMIEGGMFKRTAKTKELTQEEKSRLFAVPFNPIMERYNLQDTKSTWELWQSYQPHLEMDTRLRHGYETIQNPFVDVVISMHSGMHVDVPSMLQLVRDLTEDINHEYTDFLADFPAVPKLKWEKESKEWVATGELTEPNLGSPNDVTSLLYMHGWQPKEFNRDTGRPLTDKATLQSLVAQESTSPPLSKITKRMLDLRSVSGIKTQCMSALEIITENGEPMLYANWLQTGTKTGRMASSSPNMQNWSVRHPKWGKRIRSCFTPPPGYVMLVGDLSQVELAVLAYYLELYMGDSDMAQAVRDGEDIHDANTKNWTGVKRGDEDFKAKRSVCKNGAFASSYGAREKRLALTLCISVQEAREILNVLESSIPIEALKQFVWSVTESEREIQPVKHLWRKYTNCFFYDVMGIRHFYPDLQSKDRYLRSKAQRQVFNCLMQGGVASMFMTLCNRLLPYLRSRGGWIVSTVHDEVIFVVLEEYGLEALAEGNRCFNSIVLGDQEGGKYVPIRSSFDIVSNWSEKS
jgi:DNA polymerase I-like protein with 3'-5' exonuclease and polymerase domains